MTPTGDPTHDALLAGVIDDPRADAPRLVYADYLDETGGDSERERAAFIRAQIRLARLPKAHPDRPALRAVERDILSRRAHEWAVPFHRSIWEWSYRRGFIERAACDLEGPTDEIRALLRSAPLLVLRHMGQTDSLASVVEVLPELRHLTGLEFWGLYIFEQDDVRRILASPHLAGLRSLILYRDRNGRRIGDDVLVEAMASPLRRNLRELAVQIDDCHTGPTPAVVRAMVTSLYLRRVRHLRLQHAALDMELVAKLFDAMPRLARLDLHGSDLTPTAWRMVLERANAGQLKWLRLTDARVAPYSGGFGRNLSRLEGIEAAFDASPAAIEWGQTWRQPGYGGCWRGHTWHDGAVAEANRAAEFLRRRDPDGLEAYCRDLCVRHRGEETARLIDALPFGEYSRAIADMFRALTIPPAGTAILLRATEGVVGECVVAEGRPVDDFRPGDQRHDWNHLGRAPMPAWPREPADMGMSASRPLDPNSARLYFLARRNAAVARAAASAGVAVQVVFDWSTSQRVW